MATSFRLYLLLLVSLANDWLIVWPRGHFLQAAVVATNCYHPRAHTYTQTQLAVMVVIGTYGSVE